MALTKNSKILASDINSLKARVKAEMLRRKYTTSLASYGGTSYDYTTVPAVGVLAAREHANKIITPMNAVKATGYTTRSTGNKIASFAALEEILDTYEARSLTSNNSDCSTACAGLCHTACSGACRSGSSTGCSTTCKGGCSTTCTTTCGNTCTGGCRGSCTQTCASDCTGDCSEQCLYSCYDSCQNTCETTCQGTCRTDCEERCDTFCAPTCSQGMGLN